MESKIELIKFPMCQITRYEKETRNHYAKFVYLKCFKTNTGYDVACLNYFISKFTNASRAIMVMALFYNLMRISLLRIKIIASCERNLLRINLMRIILLRIKFDAK